MYKTAKSYQLHDTKGYVTSYWYIASYIASYTAKHIYVCIYVYTYAHVGSCITTLYSMHMTTL